MSKSNDNLSAIPKLTPILSTEIIKTIDNEIIKSYLNISNKYKIPYSELESQKPNINKICTLIGLKKRIRRTLPEDLMCMGRKLDGEQCSRSRLNNSDYCLTHQKRLPNGRIDDKDYVPKEKGKRGRKKKFSDIENSEDYIPTKILIVDGTKYLKDFEDNVYTYDLENPVYSGKFINGQLISC
jgi:hypothetical protein